MLIAKKKYSQAINRDQKSLSLGFKEAWIDPLNGSFCWGPPCYIFPGTFFAEFVWEHQNCTGWQNSITPLIQFHSPQAIQQYFKYAIKENFETFLKLSTRVLESISVDTNTACRFGSMVDLDTGKIIGHLPMSSEGEVEFGPWLIIDSLWNNFLQIHSIVDGWDR